MRSILYYIISKIKKLQSKDTEIDTEISGIKQDITDINGDISNMINSGTTDEINYIKYSDGTLIQYGQTTVIVSTSRNAGGLTYYSGDVAQTLPIDYKDTNYKILTTLPIANMNIFGQSYGIVNDKSSISIKYLSTLQNDSRNVNWITIGKWK